MMTVESRRVGGRLMEQALVSYNHTHKLAQGVFLGALTLDEFEENVVGGPGVMPHRALYGLRVKAAPKRCGWTGRPLSAVADHFMEVDAERWSIRPPPRDSQPRVAQELPHTFVRLSNSEGDPFEVPYRFPI